MSKCFLSILILVEILTCGGHMIAQELTAEQVGRDSTGHTSKSKIYMGHGKVRIEPLDEPTPGSAGTGKTVILLDLAAGTSTVLNVDRRMYLEQSPATAHQSISITGLQTTRPVRRMPEAPPPARVRRSAVK